MEEILWSYKKLKRHAKLCYLQSGKDIVQRKNVKADLIRRDLIWKKKGEIQLGTMGGLSIQRSNARCCNSTRL